MPPGSNLYVGLMSGTSMDALDCVVVQFDEPQKNNSPADAKQVVLLGTVSLPFPDKMRKKMLQLCEGGYTEKQQTGELLSWAELDHQFAKLSASAVNQLLEQLTIDPAQIRAIGSHGQTIRHFPEHACAHSLQLGDPNLIAELTGITTIADFRRRDIASGGQGAPLVPAFHQDIFTDNSIDRVVLNIGGIANITLLPADNSQPGSGFDTGPGNTLMDGWIRQHKNKPYDHDGQWAQSGQINTSLLERLLSDDYFLRVAPKSTGRELFNLNWLNSHLMSEPDIKAVDVQATLLELTARSIATDINRSFPSGEVLVCGGGALNSRLLDRLQIHLKSFDVRTSSNAGLEPLWVEATAFAWLAKQTLDGLAGNLPAVTGAAGPRILGGIYQA
ncbi:MAG: anhydro-N-acetylmuramic acid kinase [Pseudomonadales bacterium]|nr:anhydro-N-acetylmuramic acid kinase [Pseudomonadales bacterium]